jgi:membrane protein required for colicin V production
LTAADIAIVALVLLSSVIGLVRGLVREVLSLVVWVLAFLVAVGFADSLATRFAGILEPDSARLAVAFVTLFVGILIVGGLIQWGLGKLIEGTGLSGTDRLLGFFPVW